MANIISKVGQSKKPGINIRIQVTKKENMKRPMMNSNKRRTLSSSESCKLIFLFTPVLKAITSRGIDVNNISKSDSQKKNSEENYLKTEPTATFNFNDNISVVEKEKEDGVLACLTNSLTILEKIHRDLETSAKNNTFSPELNRGGIAFPIGHTERQIKSSSRKGSFIQTEANNADLNLHKNKYLNYECASISSNEKKLIRQQLEENSENRMKNYSNLFNIINFSFENIKESIKELTEINQSKLDKHDKRFSLNDEDIRKLKFDRYTVDNIDEDVEYLKENLFSNRASAFNEESCDFSETSMLENAIVTPLKLENKSSLMNYREEEFDAPKNIHRKFPVDEIINEESLDETLVQYESLLDEDIDLYENSNSLIKDEFYKITPNKVPNTLLKKSFIQTNTLTYYTNENTNFTTSNNANKHPVPNTSSKEQKNCLIY